jgi:hypothetical protein
LSTWEQRCLDPPRWLLRAQRAFAAVVKPVGSYANATYDHTVFGLVDNGVPNDFAIAKVVSATVNGLAGGGFTDVTFSAEGYLSIGLMSTWPLVGPIGVNQPFTVHEDDFLDPFVSPRTPGCMIPRDGQMLASANFAGNETPQPRSVPKS